MAGFEVSGKSSYSTLYRFRRYLATINALSIPDEVANEVRLSLEELGRNAIEWGNGEDDTKHVTFFLPHPAEQNYSLNHR